MAFTAQAPAPPLREDAAGALRVGDSRVLLELVIRAFQDGATPETIVQRYSTLALADIYAVIAYYLHHRSEVEKYLTRREQNVEEVRLIDESLATGMYASVDEVLQAELHVLRDYNATIADIRQGMVDYEHGRGEPLADAMAEIRQQLGKKR